MFDKLLEQIEATKLADKILETYKRVETDESFTTNPGDLGSAPVATLADEYGGRAQIGVDDHCYVLYLLQEDGSYKHTAWIFPEAHEVLKDLPDPGYSIVEKSDGILEKIQKAEEIENKLLSIFEGKTWEQVSLLRHLSQARFKPISETAYRALVKNGDEEAASNVLKKLKDFRAKNIRKIHCSDVNRREIHFELSSVDFRDVPAGGRIKDTNTEFINSLFSKNVSIVRECVCHIYGLSDAELLEFYGSMGDGWKAYNEPYGSDKTEVKAEIKKRGFDVREDGKKFQMVGGIRESIKEFFDYKLDGKKDEEYLTAFAISRFGFSKLSNALREGLVNEDKDRDLRTSVETLVRNELQDDPDISTDELFQNVLNGVKDGVRDDVERVLPQVYNKVVHNYFESNLTENLTDHARRELELAGMFDEEVDGSEAAGSWNKLCAEAVMELMEVFAEQGHSGFSASMTQELFSRLSKFEALTELTDNPDEWNDISEMQSGEPGWQSGRNPSCFSEDGGKTYWDINEEYYLREDEENGMVYSGGLSTEEWKNRPMHQSKHFEKKE